MFLGITNKQILAFRASLLKCSDKVANACNCEHIHIDARARVRTQAHTRTQEIL